MGERKKEEIIVPAPHIPSEQPIERDQALAIEEERKGALEVAQKVGKAFSGLMMGTGFLLLLFSIFLNITGPLTSSPEMKLLFVMMLAFLGIVNTISGLLLMGRD